MKKAIMLLAVLLMSVGVKAEDLITTTLIDHVTTVTQFKSGETNLALMDSVVLIGSHEGRSVFDLQVGFSGETKPDNDEVSAANFLVGGFFKISTLLSSRVHLPEHWEFLRALEHGVAYSYDFREKRDFVSYQVGLAFGLNPK